MEQIIKLGNRLVKFNSKILKKGITVEESNNLLTGLYDYWSFTDPFASNYQGVNSNTVNLYTGQFNTITKRPSVKSAESYFWDSLSTFSMSLWINGINFDGDTLLYLDGNSFLSSDTGGNVLDENTDVIFSTGTLISSTWHHIVITCDSGDYNIYIDNVKYGTTSYSDPTGLSWEFSFGGIDPSHNEFSVWNKILTDSDVSNLYNNGGGLWYPDFN